MRAKAFCASLTLAVLSILLLTSLLYAADEQWLQYKVSREPRRAGVNILSKSLEITPRARADVKQPDFAAEDARLCKWVTPLAEAGHVWLAIDRSRGVGPFDTLYIDSDCDGNLADEEPQRAYTTGGNSARFEPAKVVFKTADGPVTAHVNVVSYDYPQYKRVQLAQAGWYEGSVTLGGKQHRCRLVDYNSNGTYNDTSMDFAEVDRIWLDRGGVLESHFVGRYIRVDGVYYHPKLALDGAYIVFEALENVPLGTIVVNKDITSLALGGENGQLTFTPREGVVEVPVGAWLVSSWTIERKDSSGVAWKLQGSAFGRNTAFEVLEGGETALSIGEPVRAGLTSSYSGGTWRFQETLTGPMGERINLLRNNSLPPAPRLHIVSKDGSYNRMHSFQYG